MRNPAPALLEVRGLRTLFKGEQGEVRAVDGVDFQLQRGRTLGIVGESGCGKSVTALSIMGLVPQPPGRIAGGEVLFEGEDLLKCAPARMRDLRGDKRGKQSAALLVYTSEAYPALSIRVDDHSEPIAELRRIYEVAHERFIPFMRCAPTKARPWGTFDRQEIEKTIADYAKTRTRAP